MVPQGNEGSSRRLGVCSWSLQPTTPEDLVSSLRACGISAIQLALDPIREASDQGPWAEPRAAGILESAQITLLSGMMGTIGEDYTTLDSIRQTGGIRPTQHWEQNLHNSHENAALASRLGIQLVTFHAGFLPHDHHDPEFDVLLDRLTQVAEAFADHNVALAFETGQESADLLRTLLGMLHDTWDHAVWPPGVNFDPANMILYGSGDPIEAVQFLAPDVRQVHIKDALHAKSQGMWGTEVSAATGAVNWPAFFKVLASDCPNADLVIEREAGTTRIADIRAAADLVRNFVPGIK